MAETRTLFQKQKNKTRRDGRTEHFKKIHATFLTMTKLEEQICRYICKSLSEALLFAEHGENILCTKNFLNDGNNFCTVSTS